MLAKGVQGTRLNEPHPRAARSPQAAPQPDADITRTPTAALAQGSGHRSALEVGLSVPGPARSDEGDRAAWCRGPGAGGSAQGAIAAADHKPESVVSAGRLKPDDQRCAHADARDSPDSPELVKEMRRRRTRATGGLQHRPDQLNHAGRQRPLRTDGPRSVQFAPSPQSWA